MWLLFIRNVEGIWSIRRGTPDVNVRNILGCTVDTVVTGGGGRSVGIGDNCDNDVCRYDLCRLVMVDVMRRSVKVFERPHPIALSIFYFDKGLGAVCKDGFADIGLAVAVKNCKTMDFPHKANLR